MSEVRRHPVPKGSESRVLSRRVLLVFLMLVVLASAQIVWWITYQVIHSRDMIDSRMVSLERERAAATEVLRLAVDGESGEAGLQSILEKTFPDLLLLDGAQRGGDPPTLSERIVIRSDVVRQLEAQRSRKIRMFVSEGLAFLALLLVGVLVIYRTLRREVGLKRQQTNFVAAVTHELKSPLASIRLLTETLGRLTLPDEKRREYLQSILLDADRLDGLVSNILSAARLEEGRPGRDQVRLDLVGEVRAVAGALRESLAERGVELEVEATGEGVPVCADPEAMRTVVRNLIENAAKYGGGKGPVSVCVRRNGRAAVLEVRDRGIGLQGDDCQRVFQKFYRVGDEMVRRVPGSGLGLYLVRELVRESGGDVEAHSEGLGHGTTFRVSLPLEREGVE